MTATANKRTSKHPNIRVHLTGSLQDNHYLLLNSISAPSFVRLMSDLHTLETFNFKGGCRGNEEDIYQGYTR
ncbi:uncharacterized protein N7479_008172 [Penicillium vulpinum]|uniref:uncharacterized protein n=1 Tax=Penicillium vulpinum TaxID=29845 RepID=UPI002549A276|nr:uncharacterized protein N7479_008172 [Penicillium vulpinum]KAJ5961022.1 hypothetical protein N7479_008172 [Penicillium vulpinum]